MNIRSRIERLETRGKDADGSELARKLAGAKTRIARYHASLSAEQRAEVETGEKRRRQFYEAHLLPFMKGRPARLIAGLNRARDFCRYDANQRAMGPL